MFRTACILFAVLCVVGFATPASACLFQRVWYCPVPIVGPVGPIGPAGHDGAQGLPGKDGKDGKDGLQGVPGQDAKPGINGKDGKPGLDGRNGINGRDGKPGADGVSPNIGVLVVFMIWTILVEICLAVTVITLWQRKK